MKTLNFTHEQLFWAMQHDWFIHGDVSEVVCRGDAGEPQTVSHTNFKALRDWAGY